MDKLPLFSIVLQSIPEAIILICTSLILLGYSIKDKFIEIVFIGIFNSLSLLLIRSFFPFGVHTLIGLIILSITIWQGLKIDLRRSFIIAAFGITSLGILEGIFVPLLITIFHLSIKDVLNNQFARTFITYPHMLTLALIGFIAQRKKWSLIKLESLVISKTNLALIIVLLLHLFFLAFYNIINFLQVNIVFNLVKILPFAINTFFIVSLVTAVIAIKRLFSMVENEALIEVQEQYVKNVDDLFNSYRAQRHDFHNHLQTIYAMVSKSGNSEAISYLDFILDDFDELNELIRLKHTAVAALLKAKLALANSKNINLQIFTQTSLKDIKIKPHELVAILGNLVDNALDSAEISDNEDNRKVILEISRFKTFFQFKISNPGTVIEEKYLREIFTENFTTKDRAKHSGLGLSTVKKLVGKSKGEIEVTSNRETGTQFTVILPASEG